MSPTSLGVAVQPGFSWIDLPRAPADTTKTRESVLGVDGEPVHDGVVVQAAPGLYFVGLHFLYAMSSSMIHGVGRDAKRIAAAVDRFSRDHAVDGRGRIRPSA